MRLTFLDIRGMSRLPQLQRGKMCGGAPEWSEETRLNSTLATLANSLRRVNRLSWPRSLDSPAALWDRYRHAFRWFFRGRLVSRPHSWRLVLFHASHPRCGPIRMRSCPHV